MTMNWHLPRRTFLKGLGVSLALPALEAMNPRLVYSAPARPAKKPPLRMAFLYVPNGVHMQDWKPKEEGSDYKTPYLLEKLEPYKSDLLVLSGLTQRKAFANGDGGGDHARSLATFLTGCQARKTSGADIKVGMSVDQWAAMKVGKSTRFPSLEIGCDESRQAGNCDSGYSCAYSSSIAWRTESSPMGKEADPRQLFDRLFGNGNPGESAEVRAKRDLYRKSILDFVSDDTQSLRNRLGVHDQQKLDEYLYAVREIEKRIEQAASGQSPYRTKMERPTGIPKDYAEHIRLLGDLMVLSFQTDLTRICTFVFANEGSNRSYKFIDVPEGHHDLSHHGNDAKKFEQIKKINRFHIDQFAYVLNKLKSATEAGGKLLDNCMIVYGSGISDGNRHNHDDLPILLAGGAGGSVKSGRHIVYPKNTPLMNLYLSMLDRMGSPIDQLGDSSGRLSHLTG